MNCLLKKFFQDPPLTIFSVTKISEICLGTIINVYQVDLRWIIVLRTISYTLIIVQIWLRTHFNRYRTDKDTDVFWLQIIPSLVELFNKCHWITPPPHPPSKKCAYEEKGILSRKYWQMALNTLKPGLDEPLAGVSMWTQNDAWVATTRVFSRSWYF